MEKENKSILQLSVTFHVHFLQFTSSSGMVSWWSIHTERQEAEREKEIPSHLCAAFSCPCCGLVFSSQPHSRYSNFARCESLAFTVRSLSFPPGAWRRPFNSSPIYLIAPRDGERSANGRRQRGGDGWHDSNQLGAPVPLRIPNKTWPKKRETSRR
ncbi:hypothetical protein IF1G_05897 [Cordyceps javanica]|uniref:Uncharacterized protein n=1 Tax=Cordyceps javanica TaxID=43265 RepID=A0A545UZL1_9HYPO|nr:hypothetical protein IF1G_05897 [Cordyceps javanica]